MTGSGHRWTGIGAAFLAAALARLAGLPEFIAAPIALGATTLPDWIEIPIYRGGVRKGTLIPHRTITHWPFLWVGLIVWGINTGGILGAMMIGPAVGALTHILGDAPNPMGIPWLLPHKRLRFGRKGWWRSGENEFFMILTYTAFGYLVWRTVGGKFPGEVGFSF